MNYAKVSASIFPSLILASCSGTATKKQFVDRCRQGIIEDHLTFSQPGQHDVEGVNELVERVVEEKGVLYLTLSTRGIPPTINCKKENDRIFTQAGSGYFPWHEVNGSED